MRLNENACATVGREGRILYVTGPWKPVTRLREIPARSDLDDGIKGNREAIENRHWVINAAHNEPPLSSELVESRRRS